MSGFDPEWLALREPIDHAARNARVEREVCAHFAERSSLTIVDLGCGTGSNLRALAPVLSPRQHWHLVDGDATLLMEARRSLINWADARDAGSELLLDKNGREIRVSFECADLTSRDLSFGDITPDLITAAALLDLVSTEWLERLVVASARGRVPLYAVLTYDGVARWRPETALDQRVVDAFDRHQRSDKGFGPALGPIAAETFSALLSRYGYRISQGDSPWQLGSDDSALIDAVTTGFASAAAEIEPDMADAFADWASASTKAQNVVIGHRDIFAVV